MTHADLVTRAERWLRNTRRCSVVLTEASGTDGEIPDAIGWSWGNSILVECKASRSDFLADRSKIFRDPRLGDFALGLFRYYMAPAGMLQLDEIPARWGLLEVRPSSVRQTIKAKRWGLDTGGSEIRLRGELMIALSELRKIQIVLSGKPLPWKSKALDRVAMLVNENAG